MFEQVKRWVKTLNVLALLPVSKSFLFQQNTYQVILATDEIRSYVIFNYATINWTSSNEAGALTGRGGMQSAMVTILPKSI